MTEQPWFSKMDFADAVRLGRVRLTGRGLTSVPAEVFDVERLYSLDLHSNHLSTLPANIVQLTHLRVLYLGNNAFTAFPEELTQLKKLTMLSIGDNVIPALPASIAELTDLEVLGVQRTLIRTLPPELAPLIRAGLVIDVAEGQLVDPFPELLERGPEALADYLDSLRTDNVRLYEAKLLLVGEGNVGKTSLSAALIGEPFEQGRPTTHGIEIRPLTLPHPTEDTHMTVRMWDFGGQEVYRVTHQFFFSPRALYAMVWKPREGQEQNEVEGWLHRIRLRVGDAARALIIATHSNERRSELAYTQLDKAMPGLLSGQYEVDNFDGAGIQELRDALAQELAKLPQMGMLLGRRWIDARQELLSTDAPQIAFAMFAEICRRHGLGEGETRTFADLLHDLGQVIYYGDDEGLRDMVVLNPEWLTKAISYVLEDRPTREAGGVLDHRRLREIWSDSYPAAYHTYFLRLMEKFDVSYRLADDQDRSLVAQLVPSNQPDLPWDAESPIPAGSRALRLICELSEPAPGIMSWLTVRHHTASTGLHWSNGVFLRHPIGEYASEALLQLDGLKLKLQVRAPSPDLFFNVLRDSVEHLARTRWPGLRYEMKVPCPIEHCEGQFLLSGLLGLRERGRSQHACERCYAEHDISRLLTGFTATPFTALQQEVQQLHTQMSLVGHSIRRVLKAIEPEVTDCPRFFTLTKPPNSLLSIVKGPFERRFRLTLWCEHPDFWHPCDGDPYDFGQSRQWLAGIVPYANFILNTLKLVLPPAGVVADALHASVADHLGQMKELVEGVPHSAADWRHSDLERHRGERQRGQIGPIEGAALRQFRRTLFELDPDRRFMDLRRVMAPSGELLWICPEHYRDYDPGLPDLPPV